MRKLAVVFVAALVFQSTLGDVCSGVGNEHKEPKTFFEEDETVSGDVCKPYNKTPFYPGFPMTTKHQEKYSSKYNEYVITHVVKKLEVTLKNFHVGSPLMKRAFEHVVRKYFENLKEIISPEFYSYNEVCYSNYTTYSVEGTKQHIGKFLKNFVEKIEKAPKAAYATFPKETAQFERHLYNMNKVNTPVHQVAIRIQTVSDLIVNWYESAPRESTKFNKFFVEHAKQIYEVLNHFILALEKIEAHPEFIVTLQNIVSELQENADQQTLILVFQDATVEIHKYLLSASKASKTKLAVSAGYLKVLESVQTDIAYPEDLVTLAIYWQPYTNKLSTYLQNEIHPEDWNVLVKSFKQIIEAFEGQSEVLYKQVAHTVKETVYEFEAKKYLVNTFLQKLSMELDKFIWEIYKKQGRLPKLVFQALAMYESTLAVIHSNQRIVKALVSVKSPQEMIMDILTVTDRLAQTLHLYASDFQQNKLDNRVYYFTKLLEIFMYRFNKTFGYTKSNDVVRKVYDNLYKIHSHLEQVYEQPSMDSKVHLGVQMQDAFMELRELAFEQEIQHDVEFIKLYSDYFLGLDYLLNELQFNLQYAVDQYHYKTLNLQIEYLSHRVLNLLKRIQPKSQLKHTLLVQLDILASEIEAVSYTLRKMSGKPVFSELADKYSTIFQELINMTKSGSNKSVEILSIFLSSHVKTIVNDLQYLISYERETPEFYNIYMYILYGFSHIMVRLENVYHHEYYHAFAHTEDFTDHLRQLNAHISSELQNTLGESEKIKYDFSLMTLMFARRLQNIVFRFQSDVNVFPKSLYKVVSEIEDVGSTPSIGVNELKTEFNKYVSTVYSEIKKSVDQENYVGTEKILIEYALALEKLYFDVNQIAVRSHGDETFEELFTRIDMHVHYLLKAIEQIHPENKAAIVVMDAEYRRLLSYVDVISKKIDKFTDHSEKFHYTIKSLTQIKAAESKYHNDVDDFSVQMVESIKHIVVVLRETFWILHEIKEHQEKSDIAPIFKSYYDEFLTTVQQMHFKIRTNVVTQQKWYNLKNCESTNTFFSKNCNISYDAKYNLESYDDEFHATFAKYFNKFDKKFSNFPNEKFDLDVKNVEESEPNYEIANVFFSDYKPVQKIASIVYPTRFGVYKIEG